MAGAMTASARAPTITAMTTEAGVRVCEKLQ